METIKNEINTDPEPIIPTMLFEILRKPSPLIKNPNSGKNGISQANVLIGAAVDKMDDDEIPRKSWLAEALKSKILFYSGKRNSVKLELKIRIEKSRLIDTLRKHSYIFL